MIFRVILRKGPRAFSARKLSQDAPKFHENFEEHFKHHHIPTNLFQKTLLGVGSAAVSILAPQRGDMIACMGETTGGNAIEYMLSKMEQSEEGTRILKERPRINSKTVDLEWLKTLPENTLGKTYSNFLERYKYSPDSRPAVQFVDDIKLAYVMQRYREVHDLFHTILDMPTNMLGCLVFSSHVCLELIAQSQELIQGLLLGEVTVKWVEAIQTHLPMCISGALFGPIRLKSKHRELYVKYYLPWAIGTGYKAKLLMNVYFEKRWEQDMEDFRREMNYTRLVVP